MKNVSIKLGNIVWELARLVILWQFICEPLCDFMTYDIELDEQLATGILVAVVTLYGWARVEAVRKNVSALAGYFKNWRNSKKGADA